MRQFNEDPVKRFVDKDVEEGFSPMNPPDAYTPPATEAVAREDMSEFLHGLMDEHALLRERLDSLEAVLNAIAEQGVTRAADEGLREFFQGFDSTFLAHQQKEERALFPELARRLLESGEHSRGTQVFTGVDLMQNEHLKVVQLVAVVFNLFGLSVRLPDARSRAVVLDLAIAQGRTLVETLRLHMFREDTTIFPLAHTHIDRATLDEMGADA